MRVVVTTCDLCPRRSTDADKPKMFSVIVPNATGEAEYQYDLCPACCAKPLSELAKRHGLGLELAEKNDAPNPSAVLDRVPFGVPPPNMATNR